MQQSDFLQNIEYSVVVGSRAYNLHTPTSDFDIRGFYVAPSFSTIHLLENPPEQIEIPVSDTDKEVYWEIKKYLKLLLACNPTVIETLFSNMVRQQSPLAKKLRANRLKFISKKAYNTYRGYAKGEMDKMKKAEKEGKPIDFKNGMHVLRLLKSCLFLFQSGQPLLSLPAYDRELLLDVRSGRYTLEEIGVMAEGIEAKIDTAFANTSVPDEPDTKWVADLFYSVRLDGFRTT